MVISSIPQMKVESESMDPVDLQIYSSGLLDWEDEQALMLSLKSDARMAVSRWIQDKRYVLRLIVSAVIFLVAYFFFSLAVRDPIPMIDEFLIGIALAAVYWIYAKKKDDKADIAIAKREALYKAIEETNVTYTDILTDIESRYDAYLNRDVIEIASMLSEGRIFKIDIDPDDQALYDEFKVVFHQQIAKEDKALARDLENILQKGKRGEKFRTHLVHENATGSYDIYLLALAVAIFS